jgi:hypothetical protein
MKQPSKTQLREQLSSAEDEIESLKRVIASSKDTLAERAGIEIWEATNAEPECVCVSIGGDELPISINVYRNDDGAPMGVLVFDDGDVIASSGFLPAEVLQTEIAFVRKHG